MVVRQIPATEIIIIIWIENAILSVVVQCKKEHSLRVELIHICLAAGECHPGHVAVRLVLLEETDLQENILLDG
jgi:hypothetical protein